MSAVHNWPDGSRMTDDMELWKLINKELHRKNSGKKLSTDKAVAMTDEVYFDLVDRGFLE